MCDIQRGKGSRARRRLLPDGGQLFEGEECTGVGGMLMLGPAGIKDLGWETGGGSLLISLSARRLLLTNGFLLAHLSQVLLYSTSMKSINAYY